VKRVLFIAYHFWPLGGAGVQRNVKFVRYLREFGYEPTVVTGPATGSDRWTPADPTLDADIPPGTVVHRVPGPDPPRSGRWRGRAERWLDIETPFAHWWNGHVRRLGVEVTAGVDLVYASLVPYVSAWSAIDLARRIGRPLVVDLQDPWALDEMSVYLTAIHRRVDVWRMGRALRPAAAVVMNTPESRDRVLRVFPELREKPVISITNGFDSADFAGPSLPRKDDRFRIVHTGYLHTELGRAHRRMLRVHQLLGGAMAGVDILTRSHVFLIEAIERLRHDEPMIGERIELHLAGVLSAGDREVGEQSPAVHMLGYVSHAESVALIRSADLLFLPMQKLAEGKRVGITPGKTYEYLASGTPILAAVPEGDVRDLLIEAGGAFICGPSDVASMVEILREQVLRKDACVPPPSPNLEVLARHERRALTRELACLFDRVLGDRRVRGRGGRVGERSDDA
jgi:glycosyltransferase involved in cell wall biosynthesis